MLKRVFLSIAGLLLVLVIGGAAFVISQINAPLWGTLFGRAEVQAGALEDRLRLPEGFVWTRYATGITNARFMVVTAGGDILVSAPRQGKVFRLLADRNGDGVSDGTQVLLKDLKRPHGLDIWNGYLFVAEPDGVLRYPIDEQTGEVMGPPEPVVRGLPGGGNHWTRTVRVGPDGWMYVSIGSSCNVCEEEDARRAAMMRFRPDGSEGQIYATGLRNSVGFDWAPWDGALYATDNGRDMLGDDYPPCELNRVEEGGFYGWPYANGDRAPDPDLGAGHGAVIARSLPPAHGFGAHTAPLGMAFLDPEGLLGDYARSALVALHGSWNRSRKSGYRVVSLHWGEDGRIIERDFMTGFEADEDVIGRPVDIVQDADGAIYVSDDFTGSVYRVTYVGPAAKTVNALPLPMMDRMGGDADYGRRHFARLGCATCHDDQAAPVGMRVVSLEGLGKRYDEASLADYLAAPQPPMPLFEMTEMERQDLAAYVLRKYP
jgi:glucose/arabinose dehydrogenase/cytochrome c2